MVINGVVIMSLLGSILAFPVKAPLDTFHWIAGKIHEQAVDAYADPNRITAALLALEQELERGNIDEDTFDEREAALLAELKEMKAFLAEQEANR